MAGRVTDQDRDRLDAALVAALLLLYAGHARAALDRLGRTEDDLAIRDTIRQKLSAFARARAALVQSGINTRLERAAVQPDAAAAVQAATTSIARYNQQTLIPFLVSWASHQAMIDTYAETPAPDGDGSMRDAVQWEWQQYSAYPDDCSEAMAASPASYDEIVSITGGPPPIHSRCTCSMTPA